MKYRIGVMGSAQGPSTENQENIRKSIEMGAAIAEADCILVNGACPGLPDEAAYGAHQVGGLVMGISPAFSEKEHTEKYKSPKEYYDIILYTAMGLMERDIVNIRSSDAIILLGGGIGTLNEFTVAFDEGKPIGILKGMGGVSEKINEILKFCDRETNESIIYDSNPKKLLEKLISYIESKPMPTFEDERVTSESEVS